MDSVTVSPLLRLRGDWQRIRHFLFGDPPAAAADEGMEFLEGRGVTLRVVVGSARSERSEPAARFHNIHRTDDGVTRIRPFRFAPDGRLCIRGLEDGVPVVECNRPFLAWSDSKFSKVGDLGDHLANVATIRLIEKGVAPVHGGVVTKNGQGLLVTGLPDVGKSYSVSQLTSEGWGFLSEDVSLVDREGRAYAVPYTRSLKTGGLGALGRRLGHVLFTHPRMGRQTLIESSPVRLVPTTRLRRVYVLERSQETAVKAVNVDLALRKLLSINRLEFGYFRSELLLAYTALRGIFPMDAIMREERRILAQVLDACEVYLVSAPSHVDYPRLIRSREHQLGHMTEEAPSPDSDVSPQSRTDPLA